MAVQVVSGKKQHVVEIPELLCEIFSLVGLLDLARCNAVCRAWREAANDHVVWRRVLARIGLLSVEQRGFNLSQLKEIVRQHLWLGVHSYTIGLRVEDPRAILLPEIEPRGAQPRLYHGGCRRSAISREGVIAVVDFRTDTLLISNPPRHVPIPSQTKSHDYVPFSAVTWIDQRRVAIGYGDGRISIVDILDNSKTIMLERHEEEASSLKYVGNRLISSDRWGEEIKIWNLKTRPPSAITLLRERKDRATSDWPTFGEHNYYLDNDDAVWAFTASPTSLYLGLRRGDIEVWRLTPLDATYSHTFDNSTKTAGMGVRELQFFESRLFSATDRCLQIWDPGSATCLTTLDLRGAFIAMDICGERVAISYLLLSYEEAEDGPYSMVQFYDLNTRTELSSLPMHGDSCRLRMVGNSLIAITSTTFSDPAYFARYGPSYRSRCTIL